MDEEAQTHPEKVDPSITDYGIARYEDADEDQLRVPLQCLIRPVQLNDVHRRITGDEEDLDQQKGNGCDSHTLLQVFEVLHYLFDRTRHRVRLNLDQLHSEEKEYDNEHNGVVQSVNGHGLELIEERPLVTLDSCLQHCDQCVEEEVAHHERGEQFYV